MEDVGIKVPVQAELLTDGETGVQVPKSIGIPEKLYSKLEKWMGECFF